MFAFLKKIQVNPFQKYMTFKSTAPIKISELNINHNYIQRQIWKNEPKTSLVQTLCEISNNENNILFSVTFTKFRLGSTRVCFIQPFTFYQTAVVLSEQLPHRL